MNFRSSVGLEKTSHNSIRLLSASGDLKWIPTILPCLILIGILGIIAITPVQSQPVMSTNNFTSNNSVHFNYNSTLISSDPAKWNMTIWVDDDKLLLSKISKVEYFPYWGFKGLPYLGEGESFYLKLTNIVAGPKVNTTIYFNNGSILNQHLQTLVQVPKENSPIAMELEPQMNNLSVTINGTASIKKGNFTKIEIDWGDGLISAQTKVPFSFSHLYAKPGSYKIAVTAYSNLGINAYQEFSTPNLILEQNLPKEISFALDPKSNMTLTVWTSALSIPDNMPLAFKIGGKLTSLNANTKSISNQSLDINLTGIDDRNVYDTLLDEVNTQADGSYEYENQDFKLPAGEYKITVTPNNLPHGLSVTEKLIVIPHPLTFNEITGILFGIIGAALAITSGIFKLPAYMRDRRRVKALAKYLRNIEEKLGQYKESSITRDLLMKEFKDYRKETINLLGEGFLNENQYKIIDEKISKGFNEINEHAMNS